MRKRTVAQFASLRRRYDRAIETTVNTKTMVALSLGESTQPYFGRIMWLIHIETPKPTAVPTSASIREPRLVCIEIAFESSNKLA